jgi:hypothetical protein
MAAGMNPLPYYEFLQAERMLYRLAFQFDTKASISTE